MHKYFCKIVILAFSCTLINWLNSWIKRKSPLTWVFCLNRYDTGMCRHAGWLSHAGLLVSVYLPESGSWGSSLPVAMGGWHSKPPRCGNQCQRDLTRLTTAWLSSHWHWGHDIHLVTVYGRSSYVILPHYGDVIMGTIASQIISLTIVYSTGCRTRKTSKLPVTGLCAGNKVWWQCLVPTSTTRFASDVGYRMAKM